MGLISHPTYTYCKIFNMATEWNQEKPDMLASVDEIAEELDIPVDIATRWIAAGWTPEMIKMWTTPYTWSRWKEKDPEIAYQWYKAGFSSLDALRLVKKGVLPEVALELRKAGFDIYKIESLFEWYKAGWNEQPKEVLFSWYWHVGGGPQMAIEWYFAGWEPEPAGIWLSNGWRGKNPKEALKWYQAGFTPKEALELHEQGYRPEDALDRFKQDWLEAGWKPWDIKDWGLFKNPKEAQKWRSAGWEGSSAYHWYKVGWKDEKEALRWYEAGWKPEDGLGWYLAGWANPEVAMELFKEDPKRDPKLLHEEYMEKVKRIVLERFKRFIKKKV